MKYIVIDLETTGLGGSEGITEICAITLNDELQGEKIFMDTLTNPLREIPNIVTEITGISNRMVFNKPNFKTKLKELVDYITSNNLTIVAHNASFEKKFLDHNFPLIRNLKYICTRNAYAKKYNKDLFGKHETRLIDACRELGITFDNSQAHRAKYDVIKTIELLRKI